jgi:integrase
MVCGGEGRISAGLCARPAAAPESIHQPASIFCDAYATRLLQAGAPSPVIAANLVHSRTRTTERHYADLVPPHVAQVIRATMPKLRLGEPSPLVPLAPASIVVLPG